MLVKIKPIEKTSKHLYVSVIATWCFNTEIIRAKGKRNNTHIPWLASGLKMLVKIIVNP